MLISLCCPTAGRQSCVRVHSAAAWQRTHQETDADGRYQLHNLFSRSDHPQILSDTTATRALADTELQAALRGKASQKPTQDIRMDQTLVRPDTVNNTDGQEGAEVRSFGCSVMISDNSRPQCMVARR